MLGGRGQRLDGGMSVEGGRTRDLWFLKHWLWDSVQQSGLGDSSLSEVPPDASSVMNENWWRWLTPSDSLTRTQSSLAVCPAERARPSLSYWSWRAGAWSWNRHKMLTWNASVVKEGKLPPRGAWLFQVPESILHHAVLAGPPAGAGVVALEDERRLLSAELRQESSSLETGKDERMSHFCSFASSF